jgi:hypothetical protein
VRPRATTIKDKVETLRGKLEATHQATHQALMQGKYYAMGEPDTSNRSIFVVVEDEDCWS